MKMYLVKRFSKFKKNDIYLVFTRVELCSDALYGGDELRGAHKNV